MAWSTIIVVLCAILISVYVAAIPRHQRLSSVRGRMPWMNVLPWRRRISNSKTPPRSLSPKKKVPNNAPPPVQYRNIFPPSQRETLQRVAKDYPEPFRSKLIDCRFDEVEFKKCIMPFTANYRECGPSTYTPTGFSIEQVNALGDFPNYAELSGVPLPAPYEKFKIEAARARPYRPFRWAYHQTMSLTRMEEDWWLELESTYATRIAHRKELFAKHGDSVLACLPGSELACKELMEMALQFLCARYPQHFSLVHDRGKGPIFQNRLLKNESVINTMNPIRVLLENVPEDFACMLRNPEDGYYYFRAGVICSALGWSLGTKIGLQLKEVHGPIPDYKEKMEFSMDRYFSKLPTSKPIQRGSWGLEVDTPLFMPPGDPHETHRLSQNPDLPLSRTHLRVDWQTLRRLPLSGAIVFNFKGLFTPVEEFRDEPYVPALVLKILQDGKQNIMEYKNTWHVEHVVRPALEKWSKEHEDEGKTEKGWQVKTLEESPWFPGWEEKWHRQQGF